jgi:hypothetical protein
VLGSAVLLRVGVLRFGVADFEFDNRMSTGRVPLSLDPDASLAGDARAEDNRWLDLEDVGEVDADRSVRLIIMEQADIVGVFLSVRLGVLLGSHSEHFSRLREVSKEKVKVQKRRPGGRRQAATGWGEMGPHPEPPGPAALACGSAAKPHAAVRVQRERQADATKREQARPVTTPQAADKESAFFIR